MSPQDLLYNPVAILLASTLPVWAAGNAISKIRRSSQEPLVMHLRSEVTSMQAVVRDLLLTARGMGMKITYGGTDNRAIKAAIGQDEGALVSRLTNVLTQTPGSWSPSDRGHVQLYATPERLALIFMGEPELADTLLRYVKPRFGIGRHLAFRYVLRSSVEAARGITSAKALTAEPPAPDASSVTGENVLIGAGRSNSGG
ncbi:MAG TPA: hypothetical protein VLA88_03855 [Candidatus Saccharimonadales bacterium]|nr:hypothetical protein [Candidatus Saccharimonadales bacterium]